MFGEESMAEMRRLGESGLIRFHDNELFDAQAPAGRSSGR